MNSIALLKKSWVTAGSDPLYLGFAWRRRSKCTLNLLTTIIFCALVKIKVSYCSSQKFEDRRESRNSHRGGHTYTACAKLPPVGQGWNVAYVDATNRLVPKLKVFRSGVSRRTSYWQQGSHYRTYYQVSFNPFLTLKNFLSNFDEFRQIIKYFRKPPN